MLVGSDHRRVIPISLLGGAMFMMWADTLARILASPEELPVGIITSLAGAPFFLYLLAKSTYSFGAK
jgi:iron complex transport system permease protein